MDTQQKVFGLMLVVLGIAHLYRAHVARKEYIPSEYEAISGKRLRFRSAYIDGQSHGMTMEFKVGEQGLGIRCSIPKFDIVVPYTEMKLAKSRALIGSLVQIELPEGSPKFEISHKLAKKIEKLSYGRFGYANI